MKPTTEGQIVRFHTPFLDEDANAQYVVQEIHLDVDIPRAKIKKLGTTGFFASIGTYPVEDLQVVKFGTTDLIGFRETIITEEGKRERGIIISAAEEKVYLQMKVVEDGVETNVTVTIRNRSGEEVTGRLLVTVAQQWNLNN